MRGVAIRIGLVVGLVASLAGSTAQAATTAQFLSFNFPKAGYDYAPSVLRDGNQWVMYHCGYHPGTNSDAIFRSTSSDGRNWSVRATPVLTVSAPYAWDSGHVCDPTVLRNVPIDGTVRPWVMWYTGVIKKDATDLRPGPNKIGLAVSNDGVTFSRLGPVNFTNPLSSSYCGGNADVWGCGQPSVAFNGSTFTMSMNECLDSSCDTNRALTSTDGRWWTLGTTYQTQQLAAGPDVMRAGTTGGTWYIHGGGNSGCGTLPREYPRDLASEEVVYTTASLSGQVNAALGCLSVNNTPWPQPPRPLVTPRACLNEGGMFRDHWGNKVSGDVWMAFGLTPDCPYLATGNTHAENEDIQGAYIPGSGGPTPIGTCYNTHAAYLGWIGEVCNGAQGGTTGQARQVEAITVRLTGLPGASICYSAHVSNIGWQGDVCNGQVAGTTGLNYQMEAIRIRLVNAPGRRVCYRAHVADFGWLAKQCDYQIAGTTGQVRRMEAVLIWIE